MKSLLCCILLFLVLAAPGVAQEKVGQSSEAYVEHPAEVSKDSRAQYNLHWEGVVKSLTLDGKEFSRLAFEGASVSPTTHLPYYKVVREVSRSVSGVNVQLANTTTSHLSADEKNVVAAHVTSADFAVTAVVKTSGHKKYEIIEVLPLRKKGATIEKLETFDLNVQYTYGTTARGGSRSSHWAAVSVLASGQWFKIATGRDAIYKVTGRFLKDCGFSFAALPSASVRLYGTRSGALSMDNAHSRPDDLREITIKMVDGGDGIFDDADYFLFYGEDQVNWIPSTDGHYAHTKNPYADSAYYFVTIDGGSGSVNRITPSETGLQANKTVTTGDHFILHEQDAQNLIKSGRQWFGDPLGTVSFYDFGFTVPNVDLTQKATLKLRFAARSIGIDGTGVSVNMQHQGVSSTQTVGHVSNGYALTYALPGVISASFTPRSPNFFTKVSIYNDKNPQAQAWIDYIEVCARRSLVYAGTQMNFRDRLSVGTGNVAEFKVNTGDKQVEIWDVTDVHAARQMTLAGNAAAGFTFLCRTDSLKEFIAFEASNTLTPLRVGWVENQNLHAITSAEYVVVSHKLFMQQAQQLADHHSETDNMSTLVVDVAQIYNEFSGGAQDISAIREFLRMMRHRGFGSADELQYLLLMGDASYDYRDRSSANSNFVPSYQSLESLTPTGSVVSDDFFGLLDDDEADSTSDLVDIGIGRLPARTVAEASQMVNKILHYATSKATFGDWRNTVVLVADDPESKRGDFQDQSSSLVELADSLSPEFNFRKIYLDGFKQVSGSGGQRYPEATEAISEAVKRGALMVYYTGHGGELGWAHERVLEVGTINKWENLNNLPVFVTATCEFSRFDDPFRTSAGEYVMLNPTGGGVALLTTTRAVYSGPNFQLTQAFTTQAFQSLSENKPRLGQMGMETKVKNASKGSDGMNTRCFTLLGDPAMRLAFPQMNVVVSSVPDTISALDKVKITGYVADRDGKLISNFNGIVYPTVFDKESKVQGQNNDGEGTFYWNERRNVIFKGKASVKNGKFEFEFVVPKDINRTYGKGKLSFYADNGSYDASGAFFDFTVGGLSKNPVVDNDGPQTSLYMNNTKFVFGGMTNEDPDLYAEVWDENGINMVGTGIGHDITAVLDKKTANTLVLNDYYEADLDSYQSGKIKYPFNNLEQGNHTLSLQVWDVNNNPSEAYTEFVVANDARLALAHVLNYPNPFTTNTDFYFEHNKPGLGLEVCIEIFTVSGKLVKTLQGTYAGNGFRIGPINWNGRDEYGDLIGKGVYLYRLKVKTPSGDSAEEYERLVILK